MSPDRTTVASTQQLVGVSSHSLYSSHFAYFNILFILHPPGPQEWFHHSLTAQKQNKPEQLIPQAGVRDF